MAKSLYFSEDPEEEIESALYHLQTTCSGIYVVDSESGEVLFTYHFNEEPSEEVVAAFKHFADDGSNIYLDW